MQSSIAAVFLSAFVLPATVFPSTVSSTRASIVGGTITPSCGWPATVSLTDVGCSGTLVAPSVVVFAAHCLSEGVRVPTIELTDDWSQPGGFRAVPTQCRTHPEYRPGSSAWDFAYCVLEQGVTGVPIAPVTFGCETDAIQPGADVTIVGFGIGDDAAGDGPKREATTVIQSIHDHRAFVGGEGRDACVGDSGGSAYIRLADGTWRLFGVALSGGACGFGGTYGLLHAAVPWIEASSGLYISPCHDANGAWNPGLQCGGFLVTAHPLESSWEQCCAGAARSGASESCGGPAVGFAQTPVTCSGSHDREPGGCRGVEAVDASLPLVVIFVLGGLFGLRARRRAA